MRMMQVSCACLLVLVLMVSPGLAGVGQPQTAQTAPGILTSNTYSQARLLPASFELSVDPRIPALLKLSEVWEVSFDDVKGCPCCPIAGPLFPIGGCCLPCFEQAAGSFQY